MWPNMDAQPRGQAAPEVVCGSLDERLVTTGSKGSPQGRSSRTAIKMNGRMAPRSGRFEDRLATKGIATLGSSSR
jgi:hypothetical protein